MRIFVLLGSLNLFLAVALGAFGAHGLRSRLEAGLLVTWQTGVLYHLVHALGLVLVGILVHLLPQAPLLRSAGWALLAGIVLFSGSLYLLVLTGVRPLGAITPFGGLAFLAGWLLLALAVGRSGS